MNDSTNIRLVRTHEVDELASVLGAAFHDDPVMTWFFPDPADRSSHLGTWMQMVVRQAMAIGHAFVAEHHDTIAAGALWAPPDVPLVKDADRTALWALLAGVNPHRQGELRAGLIQINEAHITESHYYLNTIGVSPEFHGGGIGSLLLEHVLEHADRAKLPAYLESSNPRNVSLYLRQGFTVVNELELAEDVVLRPMLRPARVPQ